jgi:c(7)-type cytochrome triheme protein
MTLRRLAAALLGLAVCSVAAGDRPVLPEFAPAWRYGSVALDNFSSAAGMKPVTFDHWRHRLLYTCRLCHVDIGFAMEARRTEISAASNRARLHCGACHDGKTKHLGNALFPACGGEGDKTSSGCRRCHGRKDPEGDYESFAARKPRTIAGLVDWEEAQRRSFFAPIDQVEGLSLRPGRLAVDQSFAIEARGTWLGDVAFSHKKHAQRCGCESCHPEIFRSTARGATAYLMKDIVAGASCGACHNRVAFPLADCLRCHRAPR